VEKGTNIVANGKGKKAVLIAWGLILAWALSACSFAGGGKANPEQPVNITESNGKVTNSNGTPPREGEGGNVMSKMEDGERVYSTDGGKTWSKQAPESF